ncbi:MAG: hypothetical protein F9K40_01985 [Kofleriaceae bacterium]|nr:MAG: hypothetical protein F9K40_01985 [Kofleriaceae bacterium]MBZ0234384.1 DUF6531 domain-containing protein [Kofleriaceae bacterium]
MRRTSTLAIGSLLLLASLAAPAEAAEICGDGLDNDSDLMADEGCNPAAVTGVCESPLDCALTGTIAPKSGNATYRLPPDLDIKVPFGPALTFQRFYTSLYEPGGGAPAYRKPLGPHWGHNFMSWLDKNTSPNPDQVILHTPGGRDVLFQFSNTTGGYDYYIAQPGFHVQHLRQKVTGNPKNWELRLLDGTTYVYNWSSPTGKLIEIWDSLATPNKVVIAYDGSGQVSTVTDASGKKRLLFSYSSGVVSSVAYQTINGGTPTTRVTASYGYTSGDPTSVSIGGTTVQTMQYSGGYLTKILSDSKDVISYSYLSSTPGKVVRAISPAGEIGFEYASARTQCSGGTMLFFNKVGTTTCDDDADCGTDHLCGAETNPAAANTGVCYRAARCIQMTSPGEDLVDTVSYLDGCTGACLKNSEYDWLSTPELAGVKEADGNWTSYQRNSNGLVTLMARGDTDSDPTNSGGHKTWYLYGNSTFPGKVTEIRRISELKAGGSPACDASTTTDCARTLFTWNSNGLLGSKQEIGFTLDATGATVSYSYTTSFTYDTKGRLTQVDGPLSGANDVTDYTYWSSTDVFKDGYLKEIKRKKDTTNYLVTALDGYDYWGNATSQQEPDTTFTCRTFDASRGVLTEERVAMASQTSCGSINSNDLRTYFTYDPWLRLTKTQNPYGDCVHREYDSLGRLSSLKERDDCNPASAGDTIEYSYADSGVATDSLLMKVSYKDASNTITRIQEYSYYDSRHTENAFNPVNKSYARTFSYAADGQVVQMDHEDGQGKTEWLRDTLNRVDALRRYKTSGTYDTWDSSFVAQFGQPTSVTDDNSKSMQRVWDDLGREVKVVSPDSGTTIYVFDAAGRRVTVVEADGTAGEVQHSFTYDNLDRVLTEDYGTENCGTGQPVDISYTYDVAPVSCPTGADCTRQAGRLAHVRSTLLCSASYGDNTLDQEVFFAYDDAGRLVQEYLRDDSGRTAPQSYSWNKNGRQTAAIPPSGTSVDWTYDISGSNSNANKVGQLSRNSSAVADTITWLPFGPIASYYQQNQTCWSGGAGCTLYNIQARLTWNLAYRPVEVLYENIPGDDTFRIAYSEDARGRTTVKDYTSPAAYGNIPDSYLTYDWLDRVVCDATQSGACPTSGSALRSNINGSPPYTASNDRVQMLHRGYGTLTYTHTLRTGKDQIDYITTSPSTGTTTFGWDDRGNRISDDSNAYVRDGRTFAFDGRSNVRQITGQTFDGSNWRNYTITNAYDHKSRRVFKSYVQAGLSEAHWFFYYDQDDRLLEVKHTPNIASPSTYSIFQFYWVGTRAIAYWQQDFPSSTISRRYLHSDAENKVLEVWSWPTTGAATNQWRIEPDSFGWDIVLFGHSVYQPLRGLGGREYVDEEMISYNDSIGGLRPPLHLADGRMYDPFVAGYLQARRPTSVDSYGALGSVISPPAGRLTRELPCSTSTRKRNRRRVAFPTQAASSCGPMGTCGAINPVGGVTGGTGETAPRYLSDYRSEWELRFSNAGKCDYCHRRRMNDLNACWGWECEGDGGPAPCHLQPGTEGEVKECEDRAEARFRDCMATCQSTPDDIA